MPNLSKYKPPDQPTKRVGPGGVQNVPPTSDYEYMGEDHQYVPSQQVVVRISVSSQPRESYCNHLFQMIATIEVRVEFCVNMCMSFADVRTYQVEAPYDDRTEERAKCEIKTGRALRSHDREINSEPHYDRSAPFDLLIDDPRGILQWLGEDFAATMAQEQQQLSEGTKQLPTVDDTNVADPTQ